jgi:hypothetical protein
VFFGIPGVLSPTVAYIALPYNAILSYPALAKFMAATHHDFNVLKIPSDRGTITVRCNEKDALRSVEHVYREAATMFPANEALIKHLGDLARKKHLVSKEGAAAKRAALGPLLTRLPGRKPIMPSPIEPSEGLISPLLDMSIDEALMTSGEIPSSLKSTLLPRRFR